MPERGTPARSDDGIPSLDRRLTPDVPRMYAFDVHCNSYFPLFMALYGAHRATLAACACSAVTPALRLSPRLRSGAVLPEPAAACARLCLRRAVEHALRRKPVVLPLHAVLGLQRCASADHLRLAGKAGTDAAVLATALPFLERTELFLYPIGGIALLTPFSILVGFNPTRAVLGLYFDRAV